MNIKKLDTTSCFEQEIDLDLSIPSYIRDKWATFCLEKQLGVAEIPLEIPSSDIPQIMKDIHWYVYCGRVTSIRLQFFADGSLRILPKESLLTAILPID
jgi:hypothetical protein